MPLPKEGRQLPPGKDPLGIYTAEKWGMGDKALNLLAQKRMMHNDIRGADKSYGIAMPSGPQNIDQMYRMRAEEVPPGDPQPIMNGEIPMRNVYMPVTPPEVSNVPGSGKEYQPSQEMMDPRGGGPNTPIVATEPGMLPFGLSDTEKNVYLQDDSPDYINQQPEMERDPYEQETVYPSGNEPPEADQYDSVDMSSFEDYQDKGLQKRRKKAQKMRKKGKL